MSPQAITSQIYIFSGKIHSPPKTGLVPLNHRGHSPLRILDSIPNDPEVTSRCTEVAHRPRWPRYSRISSPSEFPISGRRRFRSSLSIFYFVEITSPDSDRRQIRFSSAGNVTDRSAEKIEHFFLKLFTIREIKVKFLMQNVDLFWRFFSFFPLFFFPCVIAYRLRAFYAML